MLTIAFIITVTQHKTKHFYSLPGVSIYKWGNVLNILIYL